MKDLKSNSKKLPYWFMYFILPIIIIIVWKVCDIMGMLSPYTLPAPEKVVLSAWELIKSGALLGNIAASIIRVLQGFGIALISALVLGVAIGMSKKIETITALTIQILKPIPPIAWIPLSILWFGIDESSKVYIIFIGAFFPMLQNVVDGIRAIDSRYLELQQVYEVSRKKIVLGIMLPGALPYIMTGIRIGLGNAWVCVVAAEMIAAVSGVGYMLSEGRSMSRPDIVILGMLIIGIVGKLMDDVVKWLSGRLIRWN